MSMSSHQMLPVLVALFCASAMAYFDPREMDRIAAPDSEDEAPPYLLHRLGSKYHEQGGNWEPAPDPQFYLLTEGASPVDYADDQGQEGKRVKRHNGPSLSIVNSLDVIRQRLLLEFARRRMRMSEDQILANREILKSIGKREVSQSGRDEMTSSAQHASSVGNTRSRPQSRLMKEWTAKSRDQPQQL